MHLQLRESFTSTVISSHVPSTVGVQRLSAGPLETVWLKMNPHRRVQRGFLGNSSAGRGQHAGSSGGEQGQRHRGGELESTMSTGIDAGGLGSRERYREEAHKLTERCPPAV